MYNGLIVDDEPIIQKGLSAIRFIPAHSYSTKRTGKILNFSVAKTLSNPHHAVKQMRVSYKVGGADHAYFTKPSSKSMALISSEYQDFMRIK